MSEPAPMKSLGCADGVIPEQVFDSSEPVRLEGLISSWPAVEQCSGSIPAAARYLSQFWREEPLTVYAGDSSIDGRFFYNTDFTGFNFISGRATLPQVFSKLAEREREDRLSTLYVGSTPVDKWMPGFRSRNDVKLPADDALASFWLGSQARVSAHYDFPDNIACVVAGERRFTLFPPEQIGNLYVGPVDKTPSGQAISLVDISEPDLERFPKYAEAVKHARSALLRPGDAIFIPSMWWHHVESREPFNLLVNYWWCNSPNFMGSPNSALMHAILALRDLPPRQRRVWQGVFDHYVFDEYCNEWAAAVQNRFAVLPSQGLNYAYHIDASLYAKFLRSMAEEFGAVRQEGRIEFVEQDPDSGYITAIRLQSGQVIEGDLFIDCTGFRGILIEQTLNAGYEDWKHWLPCDCAVAIQTESVEEPIPYTRSIAREAGWQWRIPLQHRVGNGIVFSSRHWSAEEAIQRLFDNVVGKVLTEPRVIRFNAGQRRRHWYKNCVAMGLSSGFIEPLESTSIHLIQRSIIRLMQMFPYDGIRQPDVDEFNNQMKFEIENVRDFIILHYYVTNRTDTRFWRQCRTMEIPDSLRHRIELFKQAGRVFKIPTELFGENSWIQVMLGQGLLPEQYHPIVNMMSDEELNRFLTGIHGSVAKRVSQLPTHQRFIDHYCKVSSA